MVGVAEVLDVVDGGSVVVVDRSVVVVGCVVVDDGSMVEVVEEASVVDVVDGGSMDDVVENDSLVVGCGVMEGSVVVVDGGSPSLSPAQTPLRTNFEGVAPV